MAYLEIEALSKRFEGADTPAVDGISLAVERGEFVVLLGPSGCGKTTTLQMIAGFVAPSGGALRLDKRDLADVPASQRELGMVFQSYALFPHMTAAENVAFGLEMRGVDAAERARRVDEALALVGLQGLGSRTPRRLSGGQQQRVALARALVIRPRMLLLDEPLSNLDAKLREAMQEELRHIQRTLGTTTVLVTHDQHEAMALADRVVVMNHGRIEQVAPPHEAYDWPATPFVAEFLGRSNVFDAEVRDGQLHLGGERWPLVDAVDARAAAGAGAPGAATNGRVRVAVRPERVRLSAATGAGVPGTVRSRTFQGNHWLYRVESAIGAVTVLAPNDGSSAHAEGEAVRLSWSAQDLRLRAQASPA